jgi:outer membrane protein assembly factor BamB
VPAKAAEERLAGRQPEARPVALPPAPAATAAAADWPGFRGPGRDSIIRGITIKTDWSTSPPVELWRRPIGPGWSSFAVRGDLLYTQEQRGEEEVVACYNAATGNPVWAHRDAARFWESNAGPGPRGTPTLHDGRVYTLGATGIVNALDAGDGAVSWTRNAASDTGAKVPGWGFAGSPLVVGDLVIVAASGRLVAYDAATGAPRWLGPAGGDGYSSPHLVTIDGVTQVLLMSSLGATSVAPADGKLLWKHSWPSDTRIMQPAVTADGDLLISCGDAMGGVGLRRIAVAHGPAGWTTEERWTSAGLKPSFNDFVIHDGHVFGFDGVYLACIDAKDGKRNWKGGHYGHGQLVLLRDQGLLLVLSEQGELALVKAASDQFTELAHFPAMEGKTWNHPVLVGDRLLVRNGNEMAAFRLSFASR